MCDGTRAQSVDFDLSMPRLALRLSKLLPLSPLSFAIETGDPWMGSPDGEGIVEATASAMPDSGCPPFTAAMALRASATWSASSSA
jgi:hypothetical protein